KPPEAISAAEEDAAERRKFMAIEVQNDQRQQDEHPEGEIARRLAEWNSGTGNGSGYDQRPHAVIECRGKVIIRDSERSAAIVIDDEKDHPRADRGQHDPEKARRAPHVPDSLAAAM